MSKEIREQIDKIKNFKLLIVEKNEHLIEVIPNRFVYHKSNPFFRNNILKEGLIPKGKSETWLSDTPIDGKVIFATNSDNPEDWFDSTYDDDIYKIDTSLLENEWYYDPNFIGNNTWDFKEESFHIITFNPIPSDAIELIYKGTGESTF
jgi:hypothetical protein